MFGRTVRKFVGKVAEGVKASPGGNPMARAAASQKMPAPASAGRAAVGQMMGAGSKMRGNVASGAAMPRRFADGGYVCGHKGGMSGKNMKK